MFIVASLFLSSNLLRLLGKKLIVSGTLVIKCSKGIKTQRFIGPCTSLEKKGPVVADIATGEGNRTTWKMCKKAELTHTPKNKLMKFISN
ncbi:protein transport protein Sec23A-like isoform X3 [Prunus avium]|uniref:Protein transport protein SEC23 n=1 Tax=Prunus avium TaxID=42229 RepID=A0A6P5TZN7_PRUAV|nr:protein transport protein Sec23A-like isoform X3 [Prunus avium]